MADGTPRGTEKTVLCVGLVCLDIVKVVTQFPLEDTDQRYHNICNIYYRNKNELWMYSLLLVCVSENFQGSC